MSENPLTAAFLEYLKAQESAILTARRLIDHVKPTLAAKEETFHCLHFEKQIGKQIGEYEVAYRANNLPDKFQYAYNILRQSNATISNRYHGDNYVYSYWLYGEDKIYRRLKKQAPPQSK